MASPLQVNPASQEPAAAKRSAPSSSPSSAPSEVQPLPVHALLSSPGVPSALVPEVEVSLAVVEVHGLVPTQTVLSVVVLVSVVLDPSGLVVLVVCSVFEVSSKRGAGLPVVHCRYSPALSQLSWPGSFNCSLLLQLRVCEPSALVTHSPH